MNIKLFLNKVLLTAPFLSVFLYASLTSTAQSSQISLTPLPLNDMSTFKPSANNWRIAGNVNASRKENQVMKATDGKGILVNQPSDKSKDNLFTAWEHGDIELEMEFMMPKGSNSGIYLQGRYEIQLFDSWGMKNPKHSDCGGIYERGDESKPGYEGHPPRLNVSRAPGLWQHFNIQFQAPRFDASGKKTANAKFLKVIHNGVTIHENVELSGPTRSAAFTDEKLIGPLMIQGDHGPVALRNFKYRKYGSSQLHLENVQYSYYEGKFEKLPDLKTLKPVKSGKIDAINWSAGNNQNDFALQFTSNINIKTPGDYRFELQANGASRLLIDNQQIINHDGFHPREEPADGKITLTAGTHPIVVLYSKNIPWFKPALGLYAEGPEIRKHPLHGTESLPEPDPVGDILVTAQNEPMILRSFIEHNGIKKTECALVGDPSGVHYTLDLAQGNLLQIWKGDFTNATDMWHERGEAQLARPSGSVITLPGKPALAFLENDKSTWPDSMTTAANYQFKAYTFDDAGRPAFTYTLAGTKITDKFMPEEGQMLTRELTINNEQGRKNLYYRIAEGAQIVSLPDGSYGIDDMQYYVEVKEAAGNKLIIRETGNRKELLVPINGNQAKIKYSLIW